MLSRLFSPYFLFLALLFSSCMARASGNDGACATLVGAASDAQSQGFSLRDGEPVSLVSGAKTVRGTLLVSSDGGVFRAYWQPDNGHEKYVLANAGPNAIRLISSPMQGTPAPQGQPGTEMPPQRVLSCPTLP